MSRGCLLRLRKLRIEQRLHKPTKILAEATRTFPERFSSHRVHTYVRMCARVCVYARARARARNHKCITNCFTCFTLLNKLFSQRSLQREALREESTLLHFEVVGDSRSEFSFHRGT